MKACGACGDAEFCVFEVGDVDDDALSAHGESVVVEDDVAAFVHPADGAVFSADAVFGFE